MGVKIMDRKVTEYPPPEAWTKSSTDDLKSSVSDNLSIPGVKHALEGSVARRLLWSMALLGMLAWMCFQLHTRIMEFVNKPISVNMRFINNKQIKFPAVTICNTNPFRLSGVESFTSYRRRLQGEPQIDIYGAGETYRFMSAFTEMLAETVKTKQLPDDTKLQEFNKTFWPVISEETNFNILTQHTAHQIEDMLLWCEFAGKPCSADDFTPIYSTSSVCYVFNSNKSHPLKADTVGPNGGLKLLLDAQQYDYMKNDGSAIQAGFQVLIHDQKDSSSMTEDAGFLVPPGARTIVSMKHENFTEIPPPRGTCSVKESLGECQMICLTEYIIRNCGCKELFMPGNESQCNLLERLTCSLPKLSETSAFSEACSCQPRCDRDTYPLQISSAPLSEYTDYTLKWTDDRRHKLWSKTEQLLDMVAIYEVNSTYYDAYKNMLYQFGGVYETPSDTRIYLKMSTNYLMYDPSAANSTLSPKILPLLTNLTVVMEELYEFVKDSYFFDFIQYYPEKIDEDLFTKLAYDLVRDKGEMDRFVAEVKPKTEDILEIVTTMVTLRDEYCISNVTASNQAVCEFLFSTMKLVWDILLGLDDLISSTNSKYQSLLEQLRNDEKFAVYRVDSQDHFNNFYKLNHVSLWIYFDSLSTFEITQLTTDTLTNLISDFGGNLGLYLGGSLLTLFEIFDILFYYFNKKKAAK